MAVVVQVGSRVGSRVGTHTIPWPQRVHSGSPCKPLSGAPSLLAAGLRFLGPPDPGRSPEIQSAGDMNGVGEIKKPHFCRMLLLGPGQKPRGEALGWYEVRGSHVAVEWKSEGEGLVKAQTWWS